MANDRNGNKLDLGNALATITRSNLGKKQSDLTLKVAQVAQRMFRAEDGEIKVPRKRRGADDTEYAWLQDLDAPKTLFVYMPDPAKPEEAIEVEWNEEAQLFESKAEDGTVTQYENTGNIMEMGIPDAREITGSPEAINKLQAAVSRFNNKTGKKVVVRFVKDTRDKSGRTLEATREVYRVR